MRSRLAKFFRQSMMLFPSHLARLQAPEIAAAFNAAGLSRGLLSRADCSRVLDFHRSRVADCELQRRRVLDFDPRRRAGFNRSRVADRKPRRSVLDFNHRLRVVAYFKLHGRALDFIHRRRADFNQYCRVADFKLHRTVVDCNHRRADFNHSRAV